MLLFPIIRINTQHYKTRFFIAGILGGKKIWRNAVKGSIIKFARSVKVGVIGNAGQPLHRSINNETPPKTHG